MEIDQIINVSKIYIYSKNTVYIQYYVYETR